MINCSCGKPLDKVPEWLSGVQVEFVCNNCPNRKVKNIASVTLEPEGPSIAKASVDEEAPEEEEAEEGEA